MTELPNQVPKIVNDRLRAARPGQAHPDADLLTAFAEQALSPTERDSVLEHLALCGDCREIIALALPDADVVTASIPDATDASRATVPRTPAPHKLSFAWPSLRWAALAAGVVVAASVLLIRPGKLNQPTPPSVSQVTTTAQPVPATGTGTEVASSPTAAPIVQSASPAGTNETRPKSELQLSKKREAVTPSLQAQPGMLLANNKLAGSKKESAQEGKSPEEAPEAYEVSGAAADTAATSFHGNLMARNEGLPIENAKIEKAKPALPGPAVQEIDANAQQTSEEAVTPAPARLHASTAASAPKVARPLAAGQALARHVTWAITAGVLQRSLDSGQTWQSALRPGHPLLCYAAHGADVWTGGQTGTLFHSVDGGVTWVLVQPAIKAQQLSADITHIDIDAGNDLGVDVRSPAQVVVSTSNNETWSSADGGKTWAKK
ncbi:MAG: zf-HC2 domain-containing protein [Terriglobales bacterium]|jgi:hypothetical protein